VLEFATPELLEAAAKPIARHGRLTEPRHDQSETRVRRAPGDPADVEMGTAGPAARGEDMPNVGPANQPARAPEALIAGQRVACFVPIDTVSRLRPFLRRRDSTARPQRSPIRLRNPCFELRRLLRGLYVGIISGHSLQKSRRSYPGATPKVKGKRA